MDDDAKPQPTTPPTSADAQPGPRAQLAAIVEILSVLASSGSSPTKVFDAVVTNARRLCGADVALIYLLTANGLEVAHSVGLNEDYAQFAHSHPIPVDRNGVVGRVTLDRTTQQITDVLADPSFRNREYQRRGGFRTIMGAPMLIGDEVVGVLSVW
ncbi:MAG TPA: GAF domain-containing protein, partial [Lapillicoccus sp.]|nr:GAF domain-containing protein [Lapillicoccus sp.]